MTNENYIGKPSFVKLWSSKILFPFLEKLEQIVLRKGAPSQLLLKKNTENHSLVTILGQLPWIKYMGHAERKSPNLTLLSFGLADSSFYV